MTFGPTDRSGLTRLDGGVTAAPGFRAGGVAIGLKPSGKPDLALVTSDGLATCAVATTTNLVKAAPCVVTERNAADGRARAVVINAGNANACTGDRGLRDARATAVAVGEHLGVNADDVLVLSTGVIGVPMDIDRVVTGIPTVVADLTDDGGHRAATAFCTTDAFVKEVAYRATDATGSCTVGGMVKGAGMIEPAMATMLCVITTDAALPAPVLKPMVKQVVARTFNRISVDGCGSTNDTVVVLSGGTAPTPPALATFRTALEAVCADLARMVVADGEGAGRIAEIRVAGAPTEDDAVALARSVAGSVLFRCALAGGDPNWGRILAAMGASGTTFDPHRVNVTIGGITVCRFGAAASFDRGQATTQMSKDVVPIDVDLGAGSAEATFLTSDLTGAYVSFNTEYTT